MFGHHETAQATVLLAEMVISAWEGEHHTTYEFVLEVQPSNGQAFRAKTRHSFPSFTPHPEVGDMVYVKYDLKSLKVELHIHGDNRYGWEGEKHKEQVQRQAEEARRDALLAAPPGTPVSFTNAPGSGVNNVDPELQELMRLEEAERQAAQAGGQQLPSFKQTMAARGTQMPGGFPDAASPSNAQAAWLEARTLHRELMHSGVSGQAKILRKQRTGEPVHHHTPFFVEALVQPDNMASSFVCSFTAWVDPTKGMLKEGHTLPVKYDPQNPARIVFDLPA
ncbi:MAG TPA: hypothetical protein VFU69_02370 [Ktedonobacterales bacterium]|nr:hypothetical protein [Ktedonobacterales bacterium]